MTWQLLIEWPVRRRELLQREKPWCKNPSVPSKVHTVPSCLAHSPEQNYWLSPSPSTSTCMHTQAQTKPHTLLEVVGNWELQLWWGSRDNSNKGRDLWQVFPVGVGFSCKTAARMLSYLYLFGRALVLLPWSQRFSFAAKRQDREWSGERKPLVCRRCEAHYHATIGVN